MDNAQENFEKLQTDHTRLVNNFEEEVRVAEQLREALLDAVTVSEEILRKKINRPPGKPSSHYWRIYGEYWRSFELFLERLRMTQDELCFPYQVLNEIVSEPSTQNIDDWEDALDTLEDALDDLKVGKKQQQHLLAVLEVVDSTERLARLNVPRRYRPKGLIFCNKVKAVQRTVSHDVHNILKTTLEANKVSQVELQVGEYPPPETTRIITRLDDRTDDDIIIAEFIVNGYFWQDKLLRRADVIVTSR